MQAEDGPKKRTKFFYVAVEGGKQWFFMFVFMFVVSAALFAYLLWSGLGDYIGASTTEVSTTVGLTTLVSPHLFFFVLLSPLAKGNQACPSNVNEWVKVQGYTMDDSLTNCTGFYSGNDGCIIPTGTFPEADLASTISTVLSSSIAGRIKGYVEGQQQLFESTYGDLLDSIPDDYDPANPLGKTYEKGNIVNGSNGIPTCPCEQVINAQLDAVLLEATGFTFDTIEVHIGTIMQESGGDPVAAGRAAREWIESMNDYVEDLQLDLGMQELYNMGFRPLAWFPSASYPPQGFNPAVMQLVLDSAKCPLFAQGGGVQLGMVAVDPTREYAMDRERIVFFDTGNKYDLQLSNQHVIDNKEGYEGTFYNPQSYYRSSYTTITGDREYDSSGNSIAVQLRQDRNRENIKIQPVTWEQITGFIGGAYGIASLVVLLCFKFKRYDETSKAYVYSPIGAGGFIATATGSAGADDAGAELSL